MRPKVLVTGSGGLLGYALRELLPGAAFVTRRDANLTELRSAQELFEKVRPEQVIHLAANVGGVKKNAACNADLFTENVQVNTNVLDTARKQGVSRLVAVLSSCAYATYADRPSTEEDLHMNLPFPGNMGYGFSKRMLDLHARLLHEQYGSRFSTLTPVTLYGPNDNFDLVEGHVVGSLIHKCYLAKQQKRPFEVWGSGRAVRQFVFSYDIARLLLRSLESFEGPETVIAAADHGISIQELANAIAQAMQFEGDIRFDATQPEGVLRRVIESVRFAKRFPGFTFTPLSEGLQKTVTWFCSQLGSGQGQPERFRTRVEASAMIS